VRCILVHELGIIRRHYSIFLTHDAQVFQLVPVWFEVGAGVVAGVAAQLDFDCLKDCVDLLERAAAK
jgi:Trk-type K+ transport system membrane component